MRKHKKKSRFKQLEKKILCSSLALLMGTMVINPKFVSHIYAENLIIQSDFKETLAKDEMSSTVRLYIEEKEGQQVKSLKMPDEKVIEHKDFQKDEDGKFYFDFQAEENKKLEYEVRYVELTAHEVTEAAALGSGDAEITEPSDVKKETLTYEVKDLKSLDDFKLDITAEDVTYTLGQDVDLRKGITVLNEDGENISDTLELSVVDYGGFKEKTPGTYTLKYEVKHPVSKKAYAFTRKIAIQEKEAETKAPQQSGKNVERADMAVNDVSIALSENNETLRDPRDFMIGKSNQLNFAAKVKYSSEITEKGRTLKVTIPTGFTIAKVPSSSEITLADSIKQEGNTLYITFPDNTRIEAMFDVYVKQNWEDLYDEASQKALTKTFTVESESNQGKKSDEFSFQVEEFAENDYQIEATTKYNFDTFYDTFYNSYDKYGRFLFKIEKKAYTKTDSFKILLPGKFEDVEMRIFSHENDHKYYDTLSLTINGRKIPTEERWDYMKHEYDNKSGHYVLTFNNNQGRYLEDTKINVQFVYLKKLYSNNLYQSEKDFKMILNGTEKNLGKLTADLRRDFDIIGTEIWEEKEPYRINTFGQKLNYPVPYIKLPDRYFLEDLTYEFEIPYELQISHVIDGTNYNSLDGIPRPVVFYTNKGNVYRYESINIAEYLNDLKGKLQDGERVTKLLFKKFGVIGRADRPLYDITYDIGDKHEDGSPIKDGDKVKIKSKVYSSTDKNVEPSEYEREISFKVQPNDDMSIVRYTEQKQEVLVGSPNYLAGVTPVQKNEETKTYKNAVFKFEGAEMLSLVDHVRLHDLRRGDEDPVEHGKDISKHIDYYKIVYSTNKRENVVIRAGVNRDLDLDEDEYVTALEIHVEKLDLTREYLMKETSRKFDFINLYSTSIKEKLPLNGEPVKGYYTANVIFTADESKERKLEAVTSDYIQAKPQNNLIIEPKNALQDDSDMMRQRYNTTFGFKEPTLDHGSFTYKDVEIELKSDDPAYIRSMVGISAPTGFDVYIETSKGKKQTISIERSRVFQNFDLVEDEYITKLIIKKDEYKVDTSTKFYIMHSPVKLYQTGYKFIGIDGYKIPYTIEMTGSNFNETFRVSGKSGNISGRNNINLAIANINVQENYSFYPAYSQTTLYQGETVNVTVPSVYGIDYFDAQAKAVLDSDKYIVNPIYYIEIDKDYLFKANSLQNAEIDGIAPEVTFEPGRASNGNSVLKLNYRGLRTKAYALYESKPTFDLMVKSNAKPRNNTHPVQQVYYDFSESERKQTGYMNPSVNVIEPLIKDENHIQNDPDKKLSSSPFNRNDDVAILESSEMGLGASVSLDNQSGTEVQGHDNDIYKQELVVNSNATRGTADWIIYVPVPKKGSTVKYAELKDGKVNVLESSKSEYSLELNKRVEIPNKPIGTKISYTTDTNPVYAMDGSVVGNYVEDIKDADLSKVTMVKIEIPSLQVNQKLTPILEYKVSDAKTAIGKEIANASAYYNVKVTGDTEYTNKNGTYSGLLHINLTDFNIKGFIWDEKDDPRDSLMGSRDSAMEGIPVKATHENGNEYTAVSDVNGAYHMVLPTHGKVDLSVELPDASTAAIPSTYVLVDQNRGSTARSSIFDPSSKTAKVELLKTDIIDANAGMYMEPKLALTSKDITVGVDATVNVPAVAVPSHAKILYYEADDADIAQVHEDGTVKGLKVGKTTAKVAISDGKGGFIEETYTINVVQIGFHADYDHITIFEGGSYDAYKGIEIKDGNTPIEITNTSMIAVNTDNVDTNTVGRYPITYTASKAGITEVFTRFVYVQGRIDVNAADKNVKVNDVVKTMDGVTATYRHVNDDGSIVDGMPATVSTPQETVTSSVLAQVEVPLHAKITINGVSNEVDSSYKVNFNEDAYLQTKKDNVIVKQDATLEDIKEKVGAEAGLHKFVETIDLTNDINWDFLKDFDTKKAGNTITGIIYVVDPDNGKKVEKEITVTVSAKPVITAPETLILVEGDPYDIKAQVSIKDGNGKEIQLTDDMISTTISLDADGNITNEYGQFTTTYTYTDEFDNKVSHTTALQVNSKLRLSYGMRVDLIMEDIGYYEPSGNAIYRNHKGQSVGGIPVTYDKDIDRTKVGKNVVHYTGEHPLNHKTMTVKQEVYIHGNPVLTVPGPYRVKVDTSIKVMEGISGSFEFIEDDGTSKQKELTRIMVQEPETNKTYNQETYSSSLPSVKKFRITGMEIMNFPDNNYLAVVAEPKILEMIFSEYPVIATTNADVTVPKGSSLDDMKKMIGASASVQYGDEASRTDLTSDINWDEVKAIDTSVSNSVNTVKISVTDKDNATVDTEVTIRVAKGMSSNLPVVDKVVGDTFDPKEDVFIFDGNDQPVNLDDVTMDTSRVDMSKPGNYEVIYDYTDKDGNKLHETNIVHVHGKLQFENLDRVDLIREDDREYTPSGGSAFYMDSDGKRVDVSGMYKENVDQSTVGLKHAEFVVEHPVNHAKETGKQKVYVHGEMILKAPKDKTVKVDTPIQTTEGANSSYQFVTDDGSVETVIVPVTSALSDPYTSSAPTVRDIPLAASREIVSGLTTSATGSYKVTFNGNPEIDTVKTEITVKIGATLEDIKNEFQAAASVQYGDEMSRTDLSDAIDWSELDSVDTSREGNSYTFTISVTDRDKATTEKELTVIVSKKAIISVPEVNHVVGETFNPIKDVKVTDADGKEIDPNDLDINTDRVDMSKPGNYEVSYSYTDSLGNKVTKTNTVHVHGQLQFEGLEREDLLREDGVSYVPTKGSAYYMNSDGIKVSVMNGAYDRSVDQSIVHRDELTFKAEHPINHQEVSAKKLVYVHGELKITAPGDKTVKVNTNIAPTDGATASYLYVEDGGTTTEKKGIRVTSLLADPYTSSIPSKQEIPLEAEFEITKGLKSTATASYFVTFNGMPVITTEKSELTVKIGETADEIKKKIKAEASVHYGDDANATNLTSGIDWSELDTLDTSKENTTQKIKLSVTDRDGETAEKIITIHVSKKGAINVPSVDKVVGETFDPMDSVEIIDGNGKPVPMDKVTVTGDDNVDTSKPGEYEVTYEYEDEHGNKVTETNTVRVHGELQFDFGRADVLRKDNGIYVPTGGSAYYIDSKLNKKTVDTGGFTGSVDISTIGLQKAEYKAVHPINHQEKTAYKNVYVHGEVILTPPAIKTVKVQTEISPTEGAIATYKKVEDDGSIKEYDATVTSKLSDPYTTETPGLVQIPLQAEKEIVPGVTSKAIASALVYFNGMPQIMVQKKTIRVRIGATAKEIKEELGASAFVVYGDTGGKTDLTDKINWEEVEKVDTTVEGASYTVTIQVSDRDGAVAQETVTIQISSRGFINVPDKDLVEGDSFDPTENVTVKDENGMDVPIDDVTITGTVDTNKPGDYDVTYEYEDDMGNKTTETSTVHVHGKLQFADLERDDVLRQENTIHVPAGGKAYYMDSRGNTVSVNGSFDRNVDISSVGLQEVTYKAVHPVNGKEYKTVKKVYVHGQVEIHVPGKQTVKVGTKIQPTKGASASYAYVEDNGDIVKKDAPVTSPLKDEVTTTVPSVQQIPLESAVEVKPHLTTTASAGYEIIFNGFPVITAPDEITVRINASAEEIKTLLQAEASVQYGDEAQPVDLSDQINWKEVEALDTSVDAKTCKAVISVKDRDLAEAKKEITIHISSKGSIHAPIVDKVVGETYDPKENVTVTDGAGNIVDMDKVTIKDGDKVDTNKPGNYDVTYEYEDDYGNKITGTTTVRVHGQLQIEGLDRVDLERKDGKTYVPDSGKAYYINSDGVRVDVAGSYDRVVDQSVTGRTDAIFHAMHPVNNETKSGTQNIYVHGEIIFDKPQEITDKVGEAVDVTKEVTASFDKVNDDGTITKTEVAVVAPNGNVTSNNIGTVSGDVEASVTINGVEIRGKDSVAVSFNGYPYIDAVSRISVDADTVTKAQLKDMMNVFAGMDLANGTTLDLTKHVKYNFLNNVKVNEAGIYHVILTVQDADGNTASKLVIVEINGRAVQPSDPVKPVAPVQPADPITPINPQQPLYPVVPVNPQKPEQTGDPSDRNENTTDKDKDRKQEKEKDTEISYVVITTDIPLTVAKDGITEEMLEAYIRAKSDRNGVESYSITSHNVKAEAGEYKVTIRFTDGTEKTVSIHVIDDGDKGLQKPGFGQDADCIIHWIILLLLLGYSVYAVTAMLKRHRDIKDLEEEMEQLMEAAGKE